MTPAHSALINHLMLKRRCCWAPGGRFCAEGRELWLEDKASCVAEDGKAAMNIIRHQSPEWAEEIKRRALLAIEKRAA